MSKKRPYREAFTEHVELFSGSSRSTNFNEIESSDAFLKILEENPLKLVVLMCYSDSVKACEQMRGIFNDLASKFPESIFLEIDTEKEEDIAASQKIEIMPTFIIYKDSKALDRIEGAFPEKLKSSLYKISGKEMEASEVSLPLGIEDLVHYINVKKSECLNSSDDTPFVDFMTGKKNLLSDCDEQLLISYGFNQEVKLHSIKIESPVDTGPSSIKIFANQLKSMDFDDATSLTCIQEISLSPKDLKGDSLVELYRVKFQNVINVYFFIPGNQSGGEVTQINSLKIYGEPVNKSKGISGHTSSVVKCC